MDKTVQVPVKWLEELMKLGDDLYADPYYTGTANSVVISQAKLAKLKGFIQSAKFLNKEGRSIVSKHGGMKWKIGEWYHVDDRGITAEHVDELVALFTKHSKQAYEKGYNSGYVGAKRGKSKKGDEALRAMITDIVDDRLTQLTNFQDSNLNLTETGMELLSKSIEAIQAIQSKPISRKDVEQTLDNTKTSIQQHTVPEGKNLASKSYVFNTIEFEKAKLLGGNDEGNT